MPPATPPELPTSPTLPATLATHRATALARLAHSRARLHQHLFPPPAPALFGSRAAPGPLPRRAAALWRYWRRRAHQAPALSLVLEAGRGWWQRQAWREPLVGAASALRAEVVPTIRRYPLASASAAAGLGLLLAWARPWSWPLVSRQIQPLPGRARRWAVRAAADLPLQAIASSLLLLWAQRRQTAASPAAAAPATQPPPMAAGTEGPNAPSG